MEKVSEKKCCSSKNWLKRTVNSLTLAFWTFYSSLLLPSLASASVVDEIKGSKNNGAFDGATKSAKQIGQSAYQLMIVIGGCVLIISLLILGIMLNFHAGNQQETAKSKNHAVDIGIGACIVFAAGSIVSILIGFAKTI